jgi:hypothetical protein
VADAASDLSTMRWALLLDAPLLLFVPAVLFVGAVAGARQRTAAIGSGVAFMGTLAAVFLLANDILLDEAAKSNELVNDYQHNVLFGMMLVLYVAGQVIGCVLLAIALWRVRAVPRWAALAVGAFAIVGFAVPRQAPRWQSPASEPTRSRCDAMPSSRRQLTAPPQSGLRTPEPAGRRMGEQLDRRDGQSWMTVSPSEVSNRPASGVGRPGPRESRGGR